MSSTVKKPSSPFVPAQRSSAVRLAGQRAAAVPGRPGEVTVLQDVNVGVAAQVSAAICGVKVGPDAVLGRAVDRSGETSIVCRSENGPVGIEQN